MCAPQPRGRSPSPGVMAWLLASRPHDPWALAAGPCVHLGDRGAPVTVPPPPPPALLPVLSSALGTRGFWSFLKNCGRVPSGNHDIFRFTLRTPQCLRKGERGRRQTRPGSQSLPPTPLLCKQPGQASSAPRSSVYPGVTSPSLTARPRRFLPQPQA